jgi:hypothetical protein
VAGVGLTAIFVHSLFYSAFFEDPMVWGFFGVAAMAARARHDRPFARLDADPTLRTSCRERGSPG